ncbi:MAG: ABC transporter permease [Blautia sp.]|nr:ABC transporter permease [Blautia sp.]
MNLKKLPLLNLKRNPGRTLALVLLTAVLSFSIFGGTVVVSSLRRGLGSLTERLGADIIVVPSQAQSKVSFQDIFLQGTVGAFYMSRENLTRTLEVEGVEKAAAQVFLASLKADCCSIRIQVIGIDPETDFVIRPWLEKSGSRGLKDMDVVVGTKVGAEVGETLRIYEERCHVAGKLAPTGTGLDSAVYCNMSTMKKLLSAAEAKGISHKVSSDDEDVVSAIYVKVKEGYDIGKVNSAIQGHTRKASAIRTRSMITDVSSSLLAISRVILGLIGAIWGMGFLLLFLAFAMIARERQQEFALLRVLGSTKKALKGLIRKEAFLCCLSGGFVGIGLACLLVFPFQTLIEMSLSLPYLIPEPSGLFLIALGALGASVASGFASSAFAAWRLSQADPGRLLRQG